MNDCIDPDDIKILYCSTCNDQHQVMCGVTECPDCGKEGEVE